MRSTACRGPKQAFWGWSLPWGASTGPRGSPGTSKQLSCRQTVLDSGLRLLSRRTRRSKQSFPLAQASYLMRNSGKKASTYQARLGSEARQKFTNFSKATIRASLDAKPTQSCACLGDIWPGDKSIGLHLGIQGLN